MPPSPHKPATRFPQLVRLIFLLPYRNTWASDLRRAGTWSKWLWSIIWIGCRRKTEIRSGVRESAGLSGVGHPVWPVFAGDRAFQIASSWLPDGIFRDSPAAGAEVQLCIPGL